MDLQEYQLTSPEIQQLLHELRDTLSMVTEIKNEYKTSASNVWGSCDKNNVLTVPHFEEFSSLLSVYKQYKTREARLVGLITKLKGLK